MAIQLTKEQETELLGMTRVVTAADEVTLNQAYIELGKKGFIQSGENFMTLLRAYQAAPQVPITVQGVLQYTTQYRDAFQWLSATELAYRELTAQIGPDKTAEVAKLLKSHKLYGPSEGEAGKENFVALVRHSQSQGWGLDQNSFLSLINHFQRYVPNTQLSWKPSPAQQATAERWKNTRAKEAPAKSALEAAKEKAKLVSHIVNADGRRMSDVIMQEVFKAHPEAAVEAPEERFTSTPAPSPEELHWEKQTKDYIQSIASSNLRAEAEQLYGHKHHDSWRATYNLLDNWYSRRAPGRPQRAILGSVLVEEKQDVR